MLPRGNSQSDWFDRLTSVTGDSSSMSRRAADAPVPLRPKELDGAQDQAEPRRAGCEVQRPEHEIQAFPARRADGGPAGVALARRRGRLAPIAPGRVPHDDVELPRGSPRGQRRLRFRRLVDRPRVAYEKRPPDQRLEPQRLRRPRVRIELQGGQIEAEGGDANRRFADVDAVDSARTAWRRIVSRLGLSPSERKWTSRRSASTRKTPDPHVKSKTVSSPVRPSVISSSTSDTSDNRV